MISKADNIEDLESLVDESDKMAQIGPRVEIEGHEEHSDEKAYSGEGVQKATKCSFCEKCEVNCKNKKNLEDIK